MLTGIPFVTHAGAYKSLGDTSTGDQGLSFTCCPFTFTESVKVPARYRVSCPW